MFLCAHAYADPCSTMHAKDVGPTRTLTYIDHSLGGGGRVWEGRGSGVGGSGVATRGMPIEGLAEEQSRDTAPSQG